MYLRNLDLYNKTLSSDQTLIKLTVNITNKEVTIVPNMYVTYNNIVRNVSKCLIWSKALPIWQKKSCLCDSALENKWKEGSFVGTLYEEIIINTDIQEIIDVIQKNSHNLMVEVNKYLKKSVEFYFVTNTLLMLNEELILNVFPGGNGFNSCGMNQKLNTNSF